jgi:signal transduction histidine kinase
VARRLLAGHGALRSWPSYCGRDWRAAGSRRRIERNLHDGAQQRLVTLALQLSLIRRRIRQDPEDAAQLVTSAGDELAASLRELRELARGIHPAALDDGVENALEALAMRAAVPTSVSCGLAEPVPEPVAFATYFVASEVLANTAKYAGATSATVRVVAQHGHTVVEIGDDGVGGADGPTARACSAWPTGSAP